MLADIASVALWIVAVPMFSLTALLLVQVVLACGARDVRQPSMPPDAGPRPRVAVLVPAHDEALGIGAALATMRAQLAPGDRLLVVADNCSDETAAAARAAGAEVVERHDAARRGKGYALDFGIRHLETSPPDVVLVVDADCELHPGSLDLMARQCIAHACPVQALDLMHAPPGAGLKTRIAAFAWAVKNHVRPLGFHRLGLPCQLMGTGMAFPWPLIRKAPLATGHIVEDMRLGLDLAAAGAAPLFYPEAQVSSLFPSDEAGTVEQRARWERGHLGVITHEAPRALWRALRFGRPRLMAMVFDLCIPPLTLLVLLLVAQVGVDLAMLALPGAARGPLVLALLSLALLTLAVGLAWNSFGRDIVTLGELLGAPRYILAKLPMYARFFGHRKAGWVRAKRDRPDG